MGVGGGVMGARGAVGARGVGVGFEVPLGWSGESVRCWGVLMGAGARLGASGSLWVLHGCQGVPWVLSVGARGFHGC